jgi:hypothetical protein
MKVRRSLRRRSFSVSTAGWFTVLRPDQASAISGASRSPYAPPTQMHREKRGVPEAATAPSMMQLHTHPHQLMRTAWIVLAAGAATSGLLWWIMHP